MPAETASRWSIRARMLAIAVGVAALAWLVGGIVTVEAARDVDARMRDARLVQLAETLAAFAEHEVAERGGAAARPGAPPDAPEELVELDLRYRFQVWSGKRLLLRSPDAPTDHALAPEARVGFADVRSEGQRLRTYLHRSRNGALDVQVAELLDASPSAPTLPGPWVLALMLLSLVAVAMLAGALVVRALRPVAAAERELRARSPLDLAPLPTTDAPREMTPLLDALNGLLQRTAARLSREHGFTALAAHELRTPFAALRMQAQVLAREPDAARRGEQTAALLASVDRCDHLLEQLLTLSRVEQGDSGAAAAHDLGELCDAALDDLAAEVSRRGAEVQLDLAEPRLWGHRFALQTLLRNLIANAVAHSPPGATVRVASHREGDSCVLVVDDSGPGIAEPDRARVFDRFVRLQGRGGGVGLGLSIVRQVADVHGASIALLDSPLGGLRVRVSFPLAPGRGGSPAPAP